MPFIAFAFGLVVGGFAGFWGGLLFGGWGFASFVLAVFLVMFLIGLVVERNEKGDR